MRRLRLAAALLILLPVAASAAGGKAAAKAPAAPPAPPNITAAMAKGGCKAFAAMVAASPDAYSTFQSAVDGGVTVFCPTDDAVKSFMPSYKNLTADGKASLLLFHAVPVYFSLRSLKSNNGVMNTLATDGSAKNYNFTVQNEGDQVTIKTDASDGAARIKSTVYDKDPIAIYALDTVLEPVELFEPVEGAGAGARPGRGRAQGLQEGAPPARGGRARAGWRRRAARRPEEELQEERGGRCPVPAVARRLGRGRGRRLGLGASFFEVDL